MEIYHNWDGEGTRVGERHVYSVIPDVTSTAPGQQEGPPECPVRTIDPGKNVVDNTLTHSPTMENLGKVRNCNSDLCSGNAEVIEIIPENPALEDSNQKGQVEWESEDSDLEIILDTCPSRTAPPKASDILNPKVLGYSAGPSLRGITGGNSDSTVGNLVPGNAPDSKVGSAVQKSILNGTNHDEDDIQIIYDNILTISFKQEEFLAGSKSFLDELLKTATALTSERPSAKISSSASKISVENDRDKKPVTIPPEMVHAGKVEKEMTDEENVAGDEELTVIMSPWENIDVDDDHKLIYRADGIVKSEPEVLGELPYECSICLHRSVTFEEATAHTKVHESLKMYTCLQCPFSSSVPQEMFEHVQGHRKGDCPPSNPSPELGQCPKCDFGPVTRDELKSHYLQEHVSAVSEQKFYQCPKCSFSSKCRLSFHKHRQSHMNSHQCPYCEYTVPYRYLLRDHINTHTGRTPYHCHFCDYKGKHRSGLLTHMRKIHGWKSSTKRGTYAVNSNTSGENSMTFGENHGTGGKNSRTSGENSNTLETNRRTTGGNSITLGRHPRTSGRHFSTSGRNFNTFGRNPRTSGRNFNTPGINPSYPSISGEASNTCGGNTSTSGEISRTPEKNSRTSGENWTTSAENSGTRSENPRTSLKNSRTSEKYSRTSGKFLRTSGENASSRPLHIAITHAALKCNHCALAFLTKADLFWHVTRVHGKEDYPEDSTADKKFVPGPAPKRRRQKGRKPVVTIFECESCPFSTTLRPLFTRHRWRHKGEKPFGCHLCSFRTLYPNNLAAHIRRHTGERPFHCDVCGSGFYSSSSLCHHRRAHEDAERL